MKSKFLNATLLFGITVSALSLAACSGNGEDKATLFYAYSTENLMSDWNYMDKSEDFYEENKTFYDRDYTLRFDCIKGENEGAQLMIAAKENINNFDFTLPDVTSGNEKIKASNFTTAAAWYQEIESSNEVEAYSGWYPDALIPLENFKLRGFNHIKKGRNQALYINFLSTKDMKAGLYKGEGSLTIDGKEYKIPFEVNIHDVEMPEEVHQRTCYLIWYEQISIGEKENYTPEMDMKYYDFTVSKRLSPDRLPDYCHTTPEIFAESIYQYVANNPEITNFRFPSNAAKFIDNFDDYKAYVKALVDKNIELRKAGDTTTNLLKKGMYYVDDEPTAEAYERVRTHDKLIYEMKKEFEPLLKDYPDLVESLYAINNLVTVGYDANLVGTETQGGVQTWCPQFQHFKSKSARDLYSERMKSNNRRGGENVWWYGCMDPQTPYVSYHLDADLLNSRMLKYMQYNYGIQGNIYWCMCYYSKTQKGYTTGRDVWYDPMSWHNCAGDGQLLYPGVEFGINGPITTLRLESILASNEEYEYLWMIEQKVKEYNSQHGTNYVASDLLTKYFSRIYTDVIAKTDDIEFNKVRLELMSVLDTISHDLNAGMDILLK